MKYHSYSSSNSIEKFAVFLVIIVVLCLWLIPGCMKISNEQVVTITVQSKDIKNYDKSSKYLVWTEEGEVFEDTDSWLLGKFDSSDVYGKLKVGNTYKIKVVGKRIPWLSWYRNIIEIYPESEK